LTNIPGWYEISMLMTHVEGAWEVCVSL
jgi:hypothetical protein